MRTSDVSQAHVRTGMISLLLEKEASIAPDSSQKQRSDSARTLRHFMPA